jgi:hypothetical protein
MSKDKIKYNVQKVHVLAIYVLLCDNLYMSKDTNKHNWFYKKKILATNALMCGDCGYFFFKEQEQKLL